MQPVLGCIVFLGLVVSGAAFADGGSCLPSADGANPCPTPFRRPVVAPLSAMAQIGKQIFYDKGLSGSGRLACASCHDPVHHYGPPGGDSVFLGGLTLGQQGRRAVPTLTYIERRTNFSIGPDNAVSEEAPPPPRADGVPAARGAKNVGNTGASAANLVPQGGLFWDGRADTLQQQATGPLYDPAEMASSPTITMKRLEHAPYAGQLRLLAGLPVTGSGPVLLAEAMFALARYQIEEPGFHAYSSKYDAWLEGKAWFTPEERLGYVLYNDPMKGNCAACHLDRVQADGLPPVFSDHQYEALGVPRNRDLALNRDPVRYDLGVCDAVPRGRKTEAAYCGMFATPTLRNVATRKVFFHNGVFHTLDRVMEFYALRDLEPGRFYPRGADGKVMAQDDLPAQYVANLDRTDAPFDRQPGKAPALNEAERKAIIAFLGTLTDGWR